MIYTKNGTIIDILKYLNKNIKKTKKKKLNYCKDNNLSLKTRNWYKNKGKNINDFYVRLY